MCIIYIYIYSIYTQYIIYIDIIYTYRELDSSKSHETLQLILEMHQREMAPSFRKSRARFLITSVETWLVDWLHWHQDMESTWINLSKTPLASSPLARRLRTDLPDEHQLQNVQSSIYRDVVCIKTISLSHSTCSVFICFYHPLLYQNWNLQLHAKCFLLEQNVWHSVPSDKALPFPSVGLSVGEAGAVPQLL